MRREELIDMRTPKTLSVPKMTLMFAACISVLCLVANAQYFGRNKVEYGKFDFRVMKTEHFDIYYYPQEEGAVKYAARMAERWYTRHSKVFGDTLNGRQPLILYASHPDFEQTNAIQEDLGEGVGGVTEPAKRRIVLPFAGPLAETDHVIGHELVHAFQYSIAGQGDPGKDYRLQGIERLPLWFIEGMAEYFSLGPIDPNTAMWIRESARKKLPAIKDMDNPEFFPYRYGQALLAYIGGRWGDRTVARLLRVAGRRGDLNAAIDTVLHMKTDSLSREWHRAVHAQYDSLDSNTVSPNKYGPVLISSKSGGGELNVSPVVSPDGKQLVFFSERDLFSIDLFHADAQTGKITRNLVQTALDPHLQSLEFINSAGTWDPQGKRFAFAGVTEGKPILDILKVDNDDVERELNFPNLGEIYSPAWSPDGRYIAFSALVDGFSDLFLYDLKTDSLRRLTDDPYADLQPAWSPDGRTIAFSTDRFTTSLSNLKYGNYELALLDVESGRIKPLPTFETGKKINPQWTSDGKSIYFLSDRNGITNIYRLEVDSNKVFEVTNLYGGVSGITALSPAISIAERTNRLVYSVYEDGKYNIYSADSLKELPAAPVQPLTQSSTIAETLPPIKRTKDLVLAQLNDPNHGLPKDTTFANDDYHPTLSLDGVGQPSVAVGVDRFGTYMGGGVALFWSDMLGTQNLATALQIESGGGSTDLSALLGYFNTAHRLNWGGVFQQIPYITGSYNAGYGYVGNEPAYIEQQIIYRETNRDLEGVLSYPFSQVLRTEFSLGFRNISFSEQASTIATSLLTGQTVLDDNQDLPAPSALNMGVMDLALVYDNSLFGATSPILGQRYRIEVSPNVGTITWFEVLADYRKYWMPVRPFTLAARLLHYGRYGSGAEDSRLVPLFLGYTGLVRGYDYNSFTSDELVADSTGDVPILDRLFGSRLLVGNLELRFPPLGLLGIGKGYYGFLPIEVGAFYDAGVAWQNGIKPNFLGGDRKPVSSYGVALRMNLAGYAVAEVDYVKPVDRPLQGWFWQFNLTPGF
jgi:Tol biopolymer transport system component